MTNYVEKLNPIFKDYYKILSDDFPEFLIDYIETPRMQKQAGISVSCGTYYSNMFENVWYSSLDHSVAVALIIWHFTHDKKQTLSGLFHDISTPVFKHCIDFMNHDSETQESTEDLTKTMILESKEIMTLLKRDNITLNIEVSKITAMIQDLYNIYAEGQELEKRIHTKINTIKNEADTKIFVDSALLPLQRKLFEIQQMITVKTQTIMTINIVQKNNLTVIQNIDNIKNVTLGALKILAASAKAKSDQAELSKCFNNTELRLNEANIIVKNTLPENDTKLNELKTN